MSSGGKHKPSVARATFAPRPETHAVHHVVNRAENTQSFSKEATTNYNKGKSSRSTLVGNSGSRNNVRSISPRAMKTQRPIGVADVIMDDLRSGKGDEKTLAAAALKLHKISQNKSAVKRFNRDREAIHVLLESIRSKPRFSKLVEYSVDCLANLCVDAVSVEDLIEEGVVEVLLDVLKINPYNEKIQRAVNKCLASMGINAALADALGEKNIIKVVHQSLLKHNEPETHVTSCKTLAKLFVSKKNQASFIENGGLKAINHIISENSDDQELLTEAMKVLAVLTENPNFAVLAHQEGLLNQCLSALSKFPENADLVKACIQVLVNAVKADKDGKILDDLKANNALDIVISAMEANPDNVSLLELGAELLNTMAHEQDIWDALKIVKAGNQSFASASAIAKVGNLALIDENVDYIMKHGGLEALLMAIKVAMQDKSDISQKIIESATRAISRLCNNPENIARAIQNNGVELMMELLNKYPDQPNIAAEAIGALSKMAYTNEHANAIAAKGAIPVAMAAIRKHQDNPRVARAGIEFIKAFGSYPSTSQSILKNAGIKQLLDLASLHSDNPELLRLALEAQAALCKNPENLNAFVREGGIESLIEILKSHGDDPVIAKSVLDVLDVLANNKQVLNTLRDLGAVEAIFKTLESHPNDQIIQELGNRVISKIANNDDPSFLIEKINENCARIKPNPGKAKIEVIQSLAKNISMLADLTKIPEKNVLLIQKGGVPAALNAFQTGKQLPPSDLKDEIVASAASAISRFAGEEAAKDFLNAAALEGIVDFAINQKDNEPFAEKTMFLAEEMVCDPVLMKEIARSAIPEKLIILARLFPLNDKILASLVAIIGRIAAHDPNLIPSIMNANGHELVVESVYANINDPENLLNAITVMATLSALDEHCDMLVQAGAVDALLRALKVNADNVEIRAMAIDVLGRLAGSEDVIKLLGERGMIPTILQTMEEYHDVEDVQAVALSLLDQLAMNEDNAIEMIDRDAIQLIDIAAENFPNNLDIQETAARLLETLAEYMAAEVKSQNPAKMTASSVDWKSFVSVAPLKTLEALRNLVNENNGSIWRLAKEDAFATLNDMLLANLHNPDFVLAVALSLDHLFSAAGDDLGNLDNLSQILDVTADVFNNLDFSMLSSDQLRSLLRHLYNLSKSKANRRALIAKGIIEPLMSIWISHSKDADTLAELARLLGLYINEEELLKRFSRDNSIRALIEAMKHHLESEHFERYAEYLLGGLVLYEPLKLETIKWKGIEVTSIIMDRWEFSKGVITNCNFLLANCSFNCEEVVSKIVNGTALPSLILSMENHPDGVDLLESAATVISNLSYGNDANKQKIAKLGASKALVDVVLKNYSQASLLMAVFRAIGNLAYLEENVPVIIQEGAIQAIVAGMTVHMENLDLIQIAIGVMTNLAADAKEENQAIMAQEGAVQAVVEVTNSHFNSPDVEVAAISCLCNLVQEEYNAGMVVKQGGVAGVIRAMQKLDYDEQLMQTAMRLLHEVSKNEVINYKIIKTKHSIETVCDAMRKYYSDQEITSDALRVIFYLSTSKESAESVGKRGALLLVLKMCESRIRDLVPLKESFRALGALARSEYCAEKMAIESMELVIKGLQLHYKDKLFCELVLGFVGNVCCFDEPADLVGSTEIIPVIISTVNSKQDIKIVVLRGLRALENMAYSSDINKNKLKKEGALMLIETLRKYWVRDSEVEQACQSAIDAMFNRKRRDHMADAYISIRNRLQDAQKMDGQDLPQMVKNMLIAGTLMIKHSNNAKPRPRHVFVSRDFKKLCWKDPKKPTEEAKFLKMNDIKVINKGLCTPQLRRKGPLGKNYAQEHLAFACLSKDRNISLEASSEKERDEWVDHLNALKLYQKNLKTGQIRPYL